MFFWIDNFANARPSYGSIHLPKTDSETVYSINCRWELVGNSTDKVNSSKYRVITVVIYLLLVSNYNTHARPSRCFRANEGVRQDLRYDKRPSRPFCTRKIGSPRSTQVPNSLLVLGTVIYGIWNRAELRESAIYIPPDRLYMGEKRDQKNVRKLPSAWVKKLRSCRVATYLQSWILKPLSM